MSDIIDEIDTLVDEQMAGGEPQTGFNYGDPTYPKCPHCERHWHGLPLTGQVTAMYLRGVFREDYRVDEDDSRILCLGSEAIGPALPSPMSLWLNHTPTWDIRVGSNEIFVPEISHYEMPYPAEYSIPPRMVFVDPIQRAQTLLSGVITTLVGIGVNFIDEGPTVTLHTWLPPTTGPQRIRDRYKGYAHRLWLDEVRARWNPTRVERLSRWTHIWNNFYLGLQTR